MTEITDLDPVDSGNTAISGESLDGAIANMGRMDNTLQAFAGMLGRSIRSTYLRWIDGTDSTKRVALDLSGLPTATTRTWTAPYYSGTLGLVSDIRGYRFGLDLTTNVTDPTNDVDMAAGSAVDSAGVVSILLASALTKRVDATWVVGTNQGGRFYTTLVNGTIYLYLIRNPTTGVVDWGYSDNASNPTAGASYPAGFTQYALIGSLLRASGVNGIPLWSDERPQSITWTPVVSGNTTPGVGTYATQTGVATKIGRLISGRIIVGWTAHTGTGTMLVSLPVLPGGGGSGAASMVWDALSYTNPPMARLEPQNARIVMLQAASGSPIAAINVQSNVQLFISFQYEI